MAFSPGPVLGARPGRLPGIRLGARPDRAACPESGSSRSVETVETVVVSVSRSGQPNAGPVEHPCYGETAHARYARLHLAVAPRCNVTCAYCDRRVGDCAHVARPGVTARILPPSEVPSLVRQVLLAEPRLRVIGVAGPGEPLANPETFEALALARETWKQAILCLSTNGLLLEEKAPELARLGVRTVSVTVNAVSPAVGAHIYLEVRPEPAPGEQCLVDGESLASRHPLTGELGAAFLIRRQLTGIRRAVAVGLTVKVNTVLIPGVNFEGAGPGALETGAPRPGRSEIGLVARAVARAGASLHNIVPLIPLGAMADRPRPSCDELRRARREAAGFLPQFRLCRQCRADAVGVPGQEGGPAGHGNPRG